jgi:transcription elongation factor Elf1
VSGVISVSTTVSGLRCPRCRARSTVQSAVELRPGVKYLTLRCIICGLVYDAQVLSDLSRSDRERESDLAPAK